MTNQDAKGNYDRVGAERGVGWHSDGTFEPVPPKATLLHAVALPDHGGNTIFANMYLAYEKMPQDMKCRVEGKMAVFVFAAEGSERRASSLRTISRR